MAGLENFFKYHKTPLLFILLSSLLYLSFGYDLVRTDITKLLLLYGALFVFAFQLIKHTGFNFRLLVIASIGFRLLFLFAIPNLSQDFYRFIWDGRLILEGFNPYLYTPDAFINQGEHPFTLAEDLHKGMGSLSASHFTNYPPLKQFFFVLGNLFPGQGVLSAVIGMRLVIIAADLGTLYFGKKLLESLKLPSHRIFWYVLNPFIIIELTGNLHFEGIMIFFLVWSLYLLHRGSWKWAAVVLACSISVKLIPLLLLPLFFHWFVKNQNPFKGIKKLILFYTIIGAVTLVLFLPFLSITLLSNYSKSLGLWFGTFEFNASIYYLARAIGYSITGYNEIAVITTLLPIMAVLIILGFSLMKSNTTLPNLVCSMLFVLAFYFFLSTTVHPWYIATLVILCVFTDYKFPLVWSIVIVLSYFAYTNTDTTENLWIIGLEYVVVFAVLLWEILSKRQHYLKAQTFKNT